ncbi:MAG: chorismate synthase, partial [Phenylobacterium sp.]
MSHNTFGHLFRVTTWGESHGPALGCVVDGCPPGIRLTEADVQQWLEKRRPGQGKFVTQRQEPDAVKILSGVFSDERTLAKYGGQVTTGTPISMLIENVDQRSRDYSEIATAFRPGHADYSYWAKYGVRDYRGGGRQSARETAARVAAGAVARKIIPGVTIRGAVVQIGPHAVSPDRIDFSRTEENPFWCPDPEMVPVWEEHLEKIRKAGSSTGAIVAVEATGAPAGWGAPIYGKLDAELAAALMSINAAKGVEIGAGFAAAALTGEENADEMRANDGKGG